MALSPHFQCGKHHRARNAPLPATPASLRRMPLGMAGALCFFWSTLSTGPVMATVIGEALLMGLFGHPESGWMCLFVAQFSFRRLVATKTITKIV